MSEEAKPGLFRGVAVDASLKLRILFWVLFALIVATLCFSQFGIMSCGDELEGNLNIVFLLVPVAVGALILGFVPGVTLGIEAGALIMWRAQWTPTSYFDMHLGSPMLSVIALSLGGLCISAVLTLAGRYWPARMERDCNPIRRIRAGKVIAIIIGSFLLAGSFSFGSRGALFLIMPDLMADDPDMIADILVSQAQWYVWNEAALNAALVSIACIVTEILDANRRCNTWEAKLSTVFQRWLLLVIFMVFLIASTASFCIETIRANAATTASIDSQLDYMQLQVEDYESRVSELREIEKRTFLEKANAAAELVAADKTALTNHDRLADIASTLGLESISVTDGKGVIIADSEFGDDALGFSFGSTDSTKPYLSLIDGGDPIVEEPRASIDPDGTVSDKMRVFCGVPRIDEPGIVQVSGSADMYENLLSTASIDHLLDDYTAENKSVLVIVRDYTVVASNDNTFSGQSVVGTISETADEYDAIVKMTDGKQLTAYYDEAHSNVVFKSRQVGDYDLITFVPLPQTYASRTSTLLSNAVFFFLLFTVVFILASRLLRDVVIEPINKTNDTLEHITAGNLNERVNVRNVTEFSSLSSGINTTVDALKDSIAEAEQRNARELVTAKAIQESVLPTDFPAFPDIDRFDIYASMKPAKEVGGDFYDFFEIADASKVGFVVADVSGKGIPAALFMMTAKTQVRTYMESGISVDEAVNAANHQLCLGNDAGMFVTMLACELDYETGELTYVNAGHNPSLLLHDGSWEWMREVSGMPLGLFDGMPYDPIARQLEEGDMLYLYTDGVTEAMDADGNLFGEARLEETLHRYSDYNPRSACVGVRRAITDFTLDAEQSDDITMLALKYGVPPEEKAVMVLPAITNQLVHVCNYIHAELHRRRAPKSVQNPLDIAVEELFVNVCRYAYPEATPDNPGEVRISFEYEANPPSLTVQIADDGIPYDPLAKPDAVTPDNIADVPIGGLGILMAKRSVDEMTYERVDGSNVVTFRKGW